MSGWARIIKNLRNFLFSIFNKEFLIFLFFLFLSSVFWLVITLSESYEREFTIPVQLTHVPKGTVVTNDADERVKVTIRDKGYALLAYRYGRLLRPLTFDYRTFAKASGRGTITGAEMQKRVYAMLMTSSRVTSIKPEALEYYFIQGQEKKVPIRLKGKIDTGSDYYVTRVEFIPEEVTVYARKGLLDSLMFAYTEPVRLSGLSDTVVRTVKLQKVRGVKFEPNEVKFRVYTDVMTEASVEVPIVAVNMPAGKVLRTFPSRVKITFAVAAGNVRNIVPDMFKVAADYYEIEKRPAEKCAIYLARSPHGVRNPKLEISEVDYLIEEK